MLVLYALMIFTALRPCLSSETAPPPDPPPQTVHLDPHFLQQTAFPNSLHTPTHVLPIFDQLYVVADCWHNRILYTSSLTLPLTEWKALITDIGTPHSSAFTKFEDGTGSGSDTYWIVTEATGTNSLICLTFRVDGGNVKILDGHSVAVSGERPHKTVFVEDYKSFFSLSSGGPLLYLTRLQIDSGSMEQQVSIPLNFLEVRSVC